VLGVVLRVVLELLSLFGNVSMSMSDELLLLLLEFALDSKFEGEEWGDGVVQALKDVCVSG
jgi:hypothetical protein